MHHLLFPILAPVLAVALLGQSPTPTPTPATLNLGDPMPAFSLPKIDGTTLDSKWIQGPILVGFLSARCPQEQAVDEQINSVARAAGPVVPFIAINSSEGEGPEIMKQQSKEKKFTFNYLKDGSQDVARAYGVQSTPDFFLFYEGKLVYHGPLGVPPSKPGAPPLKPSAPLTGLMAALKAIAGGYPPKPMVLPSEGCPVKWKVKG